MEADRGQTIIQDVRLPHCEACVSLTSTRHPIDSQEVPADSLSQAGMVMHWMRVGGPGARNSMFLNGLGAIATAITVV
jgi:hypothetical protein